MERRVANLSIEPKHPRTLPSYENGDDCQIPKLPIPDLVRTMKSYLEFCAVILGSPELESTHHLVTTFLQKTGPILQDILLEKHEKIDNWLSKWWTDVWYLDIRLPVPINTSPGMVFPRRHFKNVEEMTALGALFIDDMLDYKEMLDRGELPVEHARSRKKGQPFCMQQFYQLLGICRIPGVEKDHWQMPTFHKDGKGEEWVIVACKNHLYPISVKTAESGRLTVSEIQTHLMHVLKDAVDLPPAPRVGLLTTMERGSWSRTRELLQQDENNRKNLEIISRALFLVCLDEAGNNRVDSDANTAAMLHAIHGGGTSWHSANRWFDKTVQFIISSDGMTGLCYEHSVADGVAVVRLAERALARAEVDQVALRAPPALQSTPQAMEWHITSEVQRAIDQAGVDLDRAAADLDLKVYTYQTYGCEFMKSCDCSPDVYIQLALHYAYFKMYGFLVASYEAGSLRRFRAGRVENIRSAHPAVKAWAAAMCAVESAPLIEQHDGMKTHGFYGGQKILKLFKEAVRKQTETMKASIKGLGMDNHLLALREVAKETLQELPAVFTDDTFYKMMEFKLMTSQVATTREDTFMGYGPFCPDGYGCCYNPRSTSVIFCISSFYSSLTTSSTAFANILEEALDSMKLMLQTKMVHD